MSLDPIDNLEGESKHRAISIWECLDENFEVRYDSSGTSIAFYDTETGRGTDSLIYDPESQTLEPRKERFYNGVEISRTGEAKDVPYSGTIDQEYVDSILNSLEELEAK